MGCGGSVERKLCEQAKADEMCQDACVRIQLACMAAAFDKPEELKIVPPPEVQQLKESITRMQAWAASLADSGKEAPSGGGLLAGAMAMAKEVGSAVGSSALSVAASGLTAVTEKLEENFNTVAQDVTTSKKEELKQTYTKYIIGFKFTEPTKNSKGSIDGSAFNSVKPDILSRHLQAVSESELCSKLQPDVEEAIKDHKVTKGWDAAQKAYMKAYELALKAASAEDLEKAGVTPIKCEVALYVTVEIWKALAEKMAAEEAAIRQMTDGKGAKDILDPKKSVAFALIFSNKPITAVDYDAWVAEGTK